MSRAVNAETAARVLELSGFTVDQYLELEALAEADDAVVYLSGSIVTGQANPWSDIDVFVVSDREPHSDFVMPATTNVVVPHLLPGRRIDFEYWKPSMVDSMAERLEAHKFASGESIQGATFMQIELIFIHRVRIGIPLLDPSGFDELWRRFDYGRLASFLTEEAIRHLDAEVEDLIGMHKGGDRDTAIWVARQVLDVSVQAYLHSTGITDPVAKWTMRYLEALDPSPDHDRLRRDYWRLAHPGTSQELRGGDWRSYAEDVLEFANWTNVLTQG